MELVQKAYAAGPKGVTRLGVYYPPGTVVPDAPTWLRLEAAVRARVLVEVLVEIPDAA